MNSGYVIDPIHEHLRIVCKNWEASCNIELVCRNIDATFQIWPKSLNRVTLEVVAGQAGPAFEAHLHPEEAPGFQEQKQIGY